jgi:hypothetical protein
MAVFQGKKRETWGEYLANLPSLFVRSIFRHNYPNNDVDRSEIVFKNFFLHFHPVKCHKHSLDPFYTLGLGTITMSLFLLLTLTGVILMFYYIPTEDRAYDIMKDWQDTTPFAMMYRNMHRWSAHHGLNLDSIFYRLFASLGSVGFLGDYCWE